MSVDPVPSDLIESTALSLHLRWCRLNGCTSANDAERATARTVLLAAWPRTRGGYSTRPALPVGDEPPGHDEIEHARLLRERHALLNSGVHPDDLTPLHDQDGDDA